MGRLIPFNSNSPTGSTFTAFSTFVSTRGLMRICPGLASSQSREATIGHCSDGGIIEAPLEADGAQRGKPVRDADAEANVVPPTDATSLSMLRLHHATSSAMSTA